MATENTIEKIYVPAEDMYTMADAKNAIQHAEAVLKLIDTKGELDIKERTRFISSFMQTLELRHLVISASSIDELLDILVEYHVPVDENE